MGLSTNKRRTEVGKTMSFNEAVKMCYIAGANADAVSELCGVEKDIIDEMYSDLSLDDDIVYLRMLVLYRKYLKNTTKSEKSKKTDEKITDKLNCTQEELDKALSIDFGSFEKQSLFLYESGLGNTFLALIMTREELNDYERVIEEYNGDFKNNKNNHRNPTPFMAYKTLDRFKECLPYFDREVCPEDIAKQMHIPMTRVVSLYMDYSDLYYNGEYPFAQKEKEWAKVKKKLQEIDFNTAYEYGFSKEELKVLVGYTNEIISNGFNYAGKDKGRKETREENAEIRHIRTGLRCIELKLRGYKYPQIADMLMISQSRVAESIRHVRVSIPYDEIPNELVKLDGQIAEEQNVIKYLKDKYDAYLANNK